MISLVYPAVFDNKGSVITTGDYGTLVKQAILAGLKTVVEERVLRPSFGLNDQLFTSYVPEVLAQVNQAVNQALEGYEGVTFEVLGDITEEGRLTVLVGYQVQGTEDQLEVTV